MEQVVHCGKQQDMLPRFVFKKGLAAWLQGMKVSCQLFQSLAQVQRATLFQVLPFPHLVTE